MVKNGFSQKWLTDKLQHRVVVAEHTDRYSPIPPAQFKLIFHSNKATDPEVKYR
jgi:hypothetical protein